IPDTSGGISTSRMVKSKFGGPVEESAKETYCESSWVSVRLRCLSKKSFNAATEGGLRLAISSWMANRIGWFACDDQSARYPAALSAAITVKRLGLASS